MIQEISQSIRKDLAERARRKGTRTYEWTKDRPTDWRPYTVRNPLSDDYFTNEGAWDFIADLLDRGHPVEIITLEKPPGKTGYVICVECEADQPPLYIKLELGRSVVYGRSFHYSEVKRGTHG